MQIEIWSDIRCPFCYIGKHLFERALDRFAHKDRVEVVWHSFELDPHFITRPEISLYDYLGELKGMSREDVLDMHVHVSEMGESAGVSFQFEQVVVASSFHAHRLLQLAKAKGLANEAEESLFKAYFSGGVNIDDKEALVRIGIGLGLEETAVREVIFSDQYTREVRADEHQASSLGIRGVPFFVFNRKYAVSGAQSSDVFLSTLQTAWGEFEKENTLTVIQGDTCSADGDCS